MTGKVDNSGPAAGSGAQTVRPAPKQTRPVKRSFTIAGHRTSVSLEAAFWDALAETAKRQGTSPAAIVQRIDRSRGDAGLSSALRVYLLARAGERT